MDECLHTANLRCKLNDADWQPALRVAAPLLRVSAAACPMQHAPDTSFISSRLATRGQSESRVAGCTAPHHSPLRHLRQDLPAQRKQHVLDQSFIATGNCSERGSTSRFPPQSRRPRKCSRLCVRSFFPIPNPPFRPSFFVLLAFVSCCPGGPLMEAVSELDVQPYELLPTLDMVSATAARLDQRVV